MLILKLAWRNIIGAGARTWLNVLALSFSFVTIIFTQGIYNGMNDQVEHATIDAIYGGGQCWHGAYDPLDPLSLVDAHGPLPAGLASRAAAGDATPILIIQASIYPEGRFRTILLKGIDPAQKIVSIPSFLLADSGAGIPAIVGERMARSAGLRKGDDIIVQWRDAHGAFDARPVRIVEVMRSPVQEIDDNQIWIPLGVLREFTSMRDEATIVVLKQGAPDPGAIGDWRYKDLNFLLSDLHAMVRAKTVQGSILYFVLLLLALLAIFDTQVLAIFRRRKEIGTLIALGMTRGRVIALFTAEGALTGVLAAAAGAAWGIPLLIFAARRGLELPQAVGDMGYAIGERLFPVYSAALVAGTTLLILVVTIIVSFMPTRRIARLKPTDAIRGKIS